MTVADGGAAQLSLGDEPRVQVVLPPEDKGPFALEVDEKGQRVAVRSGSGPWRVVYVGTERRAFLAPDTRTSVDWTKTPSFADAAPAIFIAASADRRREVLAQARADGGDGAIVKLLARSPEVEDPIWDTTYAALPADKQAEVQSGLRATALQKGAPAAGLARALVVAGEGVDPAAAAARVEELAAAPQIAHPRGLGLLLRIAARGKDVGKTACALLGKVKPEDDDKRVLVDAALLAVAKNATPCPEAATVLLADRCAPSLRCGEHGRVSPRDASKQDEPLCDKATTAKTVEEELARAPKDVDPGRALTPHLALAAVYAQGALPDAFARAHERRRYKLTQVDKPECESGLELGAACHCDEAAVRDQVCRNDTDGFSFGLCKVELDDKKKTIAKVSFTNPP